MDVIFLLRTYTFLILPLLASATLNLILNKDGIILTGNEVSVITNNDLNLFGIQEDVLKDCLKNYLGGRPDEVYMKSPTPWNDLYKIYKWPQVHKTISSEYSLINNFNKTTSKIPLKQLTIENNELLPTIFNLNTSIVLKNNLTRNWRENYNLTYFDVFKKMVVNAFLNDTIVWNYTILSENMIDFDEIYVEKHFNITLEPGEGVIVDLIGEKVEINCDLDFDVSISGNLVINYDKGFRGHHFYGPYLNDILQDCNINSWKTIKKYFNFEYFENIYLEIKDKSSLKVKSTYNVTIDPNSKLIKVIQLNEMPENVSTVKNISLDIV